ncbi:MAG TPA: hypothetical protein VFZ53_34695 [Polyangiaceae bacterium]
MKRFTELSTVLALAALAAASCNKHYGDLSERPDPTGGTGGSGFGGAGGMGGRARGGSGGSAVTGGTAGKYMEPPGRSVTSFFHGIVDAERAVFCFARHDDAEPVLVGDPMPQGGLDFAASFAFETLDDIELETTPLLPYVIAGDLDLIDGMACDDAVEKAREEMDAVTTSALGQGDGGAGGNDGGGGEGGAPEPPPPPRLRVAALPEIPAGTLTQGYSSLYVAVGCLGGAAFTHALEDQACGRAYSPSSPTATAQLVTLSRTRAFGKLSLQALHASLAAPALAVWSYPPDIAVQTSVAIVFDLRRGALLPRQPSTQLSITDYGVASPGWRAQASEGGTQLVSERWRDVLERAGIEAFEEGRGYTLVVVGPNGHVANNGFWNDMAIGVVDNDPEM